ncbi:MAG TPA: aldo/keto reductase [Candidatus Handelsmanbacteria bacterium]|nr:aldo/keto reductase [Candidatus Handelsmanbacteria bacterium]
MTDLATRRLGRSELQPAALGLGGAWWHKAGRQGTIAGIEAALDLGMNFLDTYPGQHEQTWGDVLAQDGRREGVYLQAKVSCHVQNERTSDHSAAKTRSSVEGSLRDLRTDYLDSVIIHGYDQPEQLQTGDILDPLAPGNALDELLKMKAEGKVRHIGIGARSAEVHKRAIATGHIELILTYLEYNLLTQAAATELFPLCRELDVGVILASPLAMGLLTGAEPDAADEQRKIRDLTEPRAQRMWRWCQERDIDIRHLAIQYCLAAPVDGFVLPGQASADEVRSSYEAATCTVGADVWREFGGEFGIGVEGLV